MEKSVKDTIRRIIWNRNHGKITVKIIICYICNGQSVKNGILNCSNFFLQTKLDRVVHGIVGGIVGGNTAVFIGQQTFILKKFSKGGCLFLRSVSIASWFPLKEMLVITLVV